MTIKGNLFELATKQLIHEKNIGKKQNFSWLDIIDYAVIIRKQLDRYGKKGEIYKAKNIHTKKIINLENKQELRHQKYIRTGK